ncbi:hypothetical protein [Nisaea denitrificans]|uniref:hypothetical protein n=1 Tax=Nisaea denitrificans TaxID=390877 RepID=UPI00048C3D36
MEGKDGEVLVGLIGDGIGFSRTPVMHEAESAAQGINCRYVLIDTEQASPVDLGMELARVRAAGFTGGAITPTLKSSAFWSLLTCGRRKCLASARPIHSCFRMV